MPNVTIPLLFKDLTDGVRYTQAEGATLAELIASLDALFPGIGAQIREGDGIAPIVAFTVDGKIASEGLATPVGPESEVCILPSFGGG